MHLTFHVIEKKFCLNEMVPVENIWNIFHWMTDINNLEYTIMIYTLLLYLIGQMCHS